MRSIRRRNKLRGKKNADRFFLLLAVALIGYALFTGKEEKPLPETAQSAKPDEAIEPPDFLDEGDNETLIEKMVPSFELKEQSIGVPLDMRFGEGIPVQCGQKVTVRYISRLLDGVVAEDFYDEEKDPVTFKIGAHEGRVIPGVEQYVIGMRKKGERHVTIPPEKAYDVEGFQKEGIPLGSPVAVRIKLLGMEENPEAYDVSGQSTIVSGSSRRMVWCGEEVTVLLYALEPGMDVRRRLPEEEAQRLTFKTGQGQVPSWLEQTVIGDGRLPPMRLGGVRTIGLSPELLGKADTKDWATLKAFAFDAERSKNNFRIHLVAIGEEKAQDIGTKPAQKKEGAEEKQEQSPSAETEGDALPADLPEEGANKEDISQ